LMSEFRNPMLGKEEIENVLKDSFGVQNIIWILNGYLAGDDTDSHIDTLARFCPNNTIVYVKCNDRNDEHYDELNKMEQELVAAVNVERKPYNLIALPMVDPVFFDGERLPASYANFLIINGAILYPTYAQPENDCKAAHELKKAFPGYEIIGINSSPLIKQHGSLHCITMQYPEGVLR
ncbi:MAG: agmatine deiminase family protein, partial [Bacteroidales bacterium]